MTITDAPEVATDEWPLGALYYSPLGLFPFQAESIARTYLDTERGGGKLICWDTGTGKSHMGMRMDTLLAEDMAQAIRQHDVTVLVCEKGKVGEWAEDFAKFTRRETRIHLGPNRLKKLETLGLPDVLITTYETGKADLARFVKVKGKRGTSMEQGPLLDALVGLNVLIIGDEWTKLRNRSSANYKAWDFAIRRIRKAKPNDVRVIGLTATPIEKGWEDAFSQLRLLRPDLMPTVAEFESYFVRSRDPYGRARYHDFRMPEFAAICAPVIDRKRKSDPDIIEQFPKKVEESKHLTMAPDQQALYEMVESLGYADDVDASEEPSEPLPGLWTTLRQVAGHPASLLRSEGALARMLVDELGEDYLRSVSSVKSTWLREYLDPLVRGQGAKAVVFTFFGQSILPILAEELRHAKFKVYENHGGLTGVQMSEVRAAFKSDPAPCIFLTSDAGSRGINLPEATYVVEYESALTYANRTQRLDRIHRIDSEALSVTCMTAIVDHTVEVAVMTNVIKRNRQTDILLGDEDAGENFLTADQRVQALQIARLSRPKGNKR